MMHVLLWFKFNVSIPAFGVIHPFVYSIPFSIYSFTLVLPNILMTFRQEEDAWGLRCAELQCDTSAFYCCVLIYCYI